MSTVLRVATDRRYECGSIIVIVYTVDISCRTKKP